MNIPFKHIPVLAEQAVQLWRGNWSLAVSQLRYVDCTTGGAGHTIQLLEKEPRATILGIDRDPEAVIYSRQKIEKYNTNSTIPRCIINHGSFGMLGHHVHKKSSPFPNELLHGILADIGVSSYQLDNPDRGFSYLQDGPLDMRMHNLSTSINLNNTLLAPSSSTSSSTSTTTTSENDTLQSLLIEPPPSASVTASDLINLLPEAELQHILLDYGELTIPQANLITRGIINYRQKGLTFTRTLEFSNYITHIQVINYADISLSQIHAIKPYPSYLLAQYCSKIYQALRIAVNAELRQLNRLLAVGPRLLMPNGSLVIITFHSLEDRMVKSLFSHYSEYGLLGQTSSTIGKLVPGDFLPSYNPTTNLLNSLPNSLYNKESTKFSSSNNITPSTNKKKLKKGNLFSSSGSFVNNNELDPLSLIKYELGPIITPTEQEIKENSRCRSATLRVLKRIQ